MSVFRVPDEAAFNALQAKLRPTARLVTQERVTPKVKVGGRAESKIEAQFAQQLALVGIGGYRRNYVFLPGRRLELDFAWPDMRPPRGIEVQGNVHRIKERFKADIEKFALALFAGWLVLPVGGDEIRSGEAAKWAQILLNLKP